MVAVFWGKQTRIREPQERAARGAHEPATGQLCASAGALALIYLDEARAVEAERVAWAIRCVAARFIVARAAKYGQYRLIGQKQRGLSMQILERPSDCFGRAG